MTPEEQARAAFRNARLWHDDGIAWSLVEPATFVGEDGTVDSKAIEKAAQQLVRSHPYLVRDPDLPPEPLPAGPSGTAHGSGRRFYVRPLADDATLRSKYRMDRF